MKLARDNLAGFLFFFMNRLIRMKVFYEKPLITNIQLYGKTYRCNHEVYNVCTLFEDENKNGISVIQQHFDPVSKHTWWGEIEPCLANDIYLSKSFAIFFAENAKPPDENGLFPTFPVRQLMWALKMLPMKKEKWETRF